MCARAHVCGRARRDAEKKWSSGAVQTIILIYMVFCLLHTSFRFRLVEHIGRNVEQIPRNVEQLRLVGRKAAPDGVSGVV